MDSDHQPQAVMSVPAQLEEQNCLLPKQVVSSVCVGKMQTKEKEQSYFTRT